MILSKKVCVQYLSFLLEFVLNYRYHTRTACDCFSASDPVGTQTQDLQNRNLTLYSTELRGLITGREVKHFFGNCFCTELYWFIFA